MSNRRMGFRLRHVLMALAIPLILTVGLLPAAAQETDLSGLTGEIVSDGSSTVGPMTQAVAEEFAALAPQVQTSVDISGTGGGFARFCQGETDIQNASRPIDEEEIATCAENGVEWYQFPVAIDGITVVTNLANDWVTCMTTDQLNTLWRMDDNATTWADINPDWTADTINLYGPGTDSGTFDYFVEAILGEDAIREDFTPSEDDNVLVEGVSGDTNGLGYFGVAYYQENQEILNAVAIDSGDGNCVEPTAEAIADGSYTPLSRPLFVYANAASFERPEVQEFMRFYLTEAGGLAADVGYVGAPEENYAAELERFENAVAGSGTPDSAMAAATPEA